MATEELDPTQGAPEGETVADAPEAEQEIETEETSEEAEPAAEEEVQPETEEKPKPKAERKPVSWELRRINEETNKRRAVERELAELRSQMAAKPKEASASEEPQPEKIDIEQIRAKARDEIRLEEATKAQQQRFNDACNATFANGKNEFGADFENAVETMSNALGDKLVGRPEFLETITEMENGHQVYFEMSKNPEEAERILSLPTSKMILELAKMSLKTAQPVVKPISKVPPPVSPVGGTPKGGARLDDDDTPMDQFATMLLTKLAKR